MKRNQSSSLVRQHGVVAVELALVLLTFLAMLVGIVEFAQLLWTMHSASEATYVGARLAAVCDKDNAIIRQRMRERLPAVRDDQIDVTYLNRGNGATCFEDTPTNAVDPSKTNVCRAVRVSLHGYRYDMTFLTGVTSIPMPPFSTTLPREYMNSANPACIH